MNFLAHLFLSGRNEGIIVGNFIGDAVKGSKYNNYEPDVKKGILLHRKIDSFTDHHPVVIESISKLRNAYGKHAGIVVDIFYDHFLSRNWGKYSSEDRMEYIQKAYQILMAHNTMLPNEVMRYLPYMISNDWLSSYIHMESMEMILNGMARRTSLPDESLEAMKILKNNYYLFDNEFNAFFIELIQYVSENLE